MRLIAILVSSLLLASTAHARTWQINLIQSHGPREISRQEAIKMMQFARSKFTAIGIKTRLGRASYSKLLNPAYNLTTYQNSVHWWARKLPPRKNIIRHVLTPPFFDGLWYIGGSAIGICALHHSYIITTSNAQYKNIDGLDRWYQSATAIAHELGHAFGARHTKSHSIMNFEALHFDDLPRLSFAPESVTQIYKCME